MSLERSDQRFTRATSGAWIVVKALPTKWHYILVFDDARPELSASVTVMFDCDLRCTMRLNRLGHDEKAAVDASRIKVLEWIEDYLHRRKSTRDNEFLRDQ